MKKTLLCLIAVLCFLNGYTQNRRPTPDRKFIYMTSIGYATGLGQIVLETQTVQNRNFNISVNQLLGYQFNPYFQMGIGAGFDIWRHTAFIPVYLNFTVNFTDTKIEPLFYANLGYSFKWYVSSVPEKMDRVVHGTKRVPWAKAALACASTSTKNSPSCWQHVTKHNSATSATLSTAPTKRTSPPTPPTLSKTCCTILLESASECSSNDERR